MTQAQDGARPLSESTIKLYRADPSDLGSNTPLSAEMTLPEFYAAWVRDAPKIRPVAPGTFEKIEDSLRKWQQATGDPPLLQIDKLTLGIFLKYLVGFGKQANPGESIPALGRKPRPLANATINVHLGNIERLISLAGPEPIDGARSEIAFAELIPRAFKSARLPKTAKTVDKAFTKTAVEQMLSACYLMQVPADGIIPPARFWNDLIRLAWLTGLRKSALVLWRWHWHGGPGRVQDTLHLPGFFLSDGYTANPEAFRLNTAGDDYEFALKNKVAKAIVLPTAAQRILESLDRDFAGKSEFVFPCSHGAKWFHDNLELLQVLAGLPKERRFKYHGFRKGHAQALPGSIDVVQRALGHSNKATTRGAYVENTLAEREAKEKMDPLAVPDSRQRTFLF